MAVWRLGRLGHTPPSGPPRCPLRVPVLPHKLLAVIIEFLLAVLHALLTPLASDDDSSSAFWSGSGSALVGAVLAGAFAIGAAFLAARLARRHDELREARHAASRLAALASDFWYDLSDVYGRGSISEIQSFGKSRPFKLVRAFTIESPVLQDADVATACANVVDWLMGVWRPAVARLTPATPNTAVVVEAGALAAMQLHIILSRWMITDDLIEAKPFPNLDDEQAWEIRWTVVAGGRVLRDQNPGHFIPRAP